MAFIVLTSRLGKHLVNVDAIEDIGPRKDSDDGDRCVVQFVSGTTREYLELLHEVRDLIATATKQDLSSTVAPPRAVPATPSSSPAPRPVAPRVRPTPPASARKGSTRRRPPRSS